MKVCVLGANGQLGSDVLAAFRAAGHEVVGLTHQQIEVTSPESVRTALLAPLPAVVINPTAFHHVEKCESEPQKAFLVNAIGARNVAQAANEIGAAVMHVSTDYVFDGATQTPYREADPPRPLHVYGNSKLSGEYFVRAG